MNTFHFGISRCHWLAAFYGAFLLTGCATTSGSTAQSCRNEQRTAVVNGAQETIPVTVCRRPEGRTWDRPAL